MSGVSAVLFDLDGVFFVGDDAIAGGTETLAWLDSQNLRYAFVTNTTSQPRSYLVDKLNRCGIDTDTDQILTPSVAAHEWLVHNDQRPVALFVPDVTAAEFEDVECVDEDAESGAAAVVIGDLGDEWTFARLNRAFRLLMSDPPPVLVALGMARYWRDTDGLVLDNGPLAQALAFASGREPVVTGKPAPAFFDAACARLGLPPGEVLMVGDDIRGDIGGAQSAGLRAALVKTGKFHPADLEVGIEPDALIGSVADLPEWLAADDA